MQHEWLILVFGKRVTRVKLKEFILYPMAYWSGVVHILDFMAMIRARSGQDQSARMVALYKNDNGQIETVIQA